MFLLTSDYEWTMMTLMSDNWGDGTRYITHRHRSPSIGLRPSVNVHRSTLYTSMCLPDSVAPRSTTLLGLCHYMLHPCVLRSSRSTTLQWYPRLLPSYLSSYLWCWCLNIYMQTTVQLSSYYQLYRQSSRDVKCSPGNLNMVAELPNPH